MSEEKKSTALAQKPPAAQLRRRAKVADKPNSSRAAGHGGSSNTMLKLYTDDSKGLSVDPVVVLVLAISFVFSVVVLHILGKIVRAYTK